MRVRLVYDVGEGRGVCVCVWGGGGGGGVINILYPSKSTDESAISIFYVSCNIYF